MPTAFVVALHAKVALAGFALETRMAVAFAAMAHTVSIATHRALGTNVAGLARKPWITEALAEGTYSPAVAVSGAGHCHFVLASRSAKSWVAEAFAQNAQSKDPLPTGCIGTPAIKRTFAGLHGIVFRIA